MVESNERAFHRFTSSFPKRNSFWLKLNMELTFQKMPGYKDGGTWNMLLQLHKGRSVKILYIENYIYQRELMFSLS